MSNYLQSKLTEFYHILHSCFNASHKNNPSYTQHRFPYELLVSGRFNGSGGVQQNSLDAFVLRCYIVQNILI